jgi:nicotinamidase/pyrazinamidase
MRIPTLFWDVDTQLDFMSPDGALYVPGAETLRPALAKLTDAACRHQIPVLSSADRHDRTDPEISDSPDFVTSFPPHCIRGSRGGSRIPETDLERTLVLDEARVSDSEINSGLYRPWPRVLAFKKALNAFSNPNVERVLEWLDPMVVVVYGVALDFCNRAVIEDLLDRGRSIVVPITDATKAICPEQADALLSEWVRRGVCLETTDSFLDQLEQPARVAVG